MDDDPFMLVVRMVVNARYNTQAYIRRLLNNSADDVALAMDTSRITYREINYDLSQHNIYVTKHNIPKHERLSLTCFRLLAHSLAEEVGRCNRRERGRLPLEERFVF